MKLQKLLKQFGTYGNEYSPIEVGDKINEIIEFLQPADIVRAEEELEKIILDNTDTKTDGYPARCPSSGDRVYYIKGVKKSWIKNPETLQKLGYDLHKVVNITNEEMDSFETDKPIDLKEYEIKEVPETKENGDTYNL